MKQVKIIFLHFQCDYEPSTLVEREILFAEFKGFKLYEDVQAKRRIVFSLDGSLIRDIHERSP